MLIEFSVANFRSFKEKQTFSLVAAHPEGGMGHSYPTGFTAAPAIRLAASIHGANASGKSNLLKAMAFCDRFIRNSSKETQKGEKIEGISPFLFSEEFQSRPSEFEIVFLLENYLYQYGFVVDSDRVHEEWLYATPNSGARQKTQKWFVRKNSEIIINPILKGEKAKWIASTRENALFLSTAVQLNSEILAKPFEWVQKRFHVLGTLDHFSNRFTAEALRRSKSSYICKDSILKLIGSFDTGISDITVTEKDFDASDIPSEMPEALRAVIIENSKGKKNYDLHGIHNMDNGKDTYALDFYEESDGTKLLFALAGPLLDILENGYTLVVDELHNSLHPLALEHIVKLFQNKEINRKNAQLIFTGHDTSVMGILPPDQVWLVERMRSGESILSSLSDFHIRKGEAVEKRYLSGRYKGVPLIRNYE